MTNPTRSPESTADALYVALELSLREWLLTMGPAPGVRPRRARVRPGDAAGVQAALARARQPFGLPAGGPVRSCCEAGRDGFWPHRFLTALGIENLVVDSSSIEVSRRARRAKTDRLDGEHLLRLLLRHWQGERDLWQVVRVPPAALEDARHASRGLTMLQQDRTRYRARLHSLLALHGVRTRIDGRLPARLPALRDWAGAPLGPGLQARVLEVWTLWQAVETACRARHRAERAALRRPVTAETVVAARLVTLRGVGPRSATILAHELFARDPRTRRQVGALTGLVGMPSHSGATQREQGVTPGGVRAVRRIAVELAWAWVRYQPDSALTQWYQRRFGTGGAVARRIGIVALARRLVIALWRYASWGEVPAGAVLTA